MTLLDTVYDMANSMNYLFKVLDVPLINYSDMKQAMNKGRRYLIEKQLNRSITNEENIKYQTIYNEYYFNHKNILTKPYDGIIELLKRLKEEGYLLAVCSNKLHDATLGLVNEIFSDTFDYVIGSSDRFLRKPSKEMIVHILKELNVKEGNTIFIGDTLADIKGAKNANLYNIAALYGYGIKELLIKENPNVLANNSKELYNIIKDYFRRANNA